MAEEESKTPVFEKWAEFCPHEFAELCEGLGGDLTPRERECALSLLDVDGSGPIELDEILAIDGVDMIQWGPGDYSMNTGRAGQYASDEIKVVEREVIDKALKAGVHPRAEIVKPDDARYYLDLGVRHFCMETDIMILFNWLKTNGEELRKALDGS